jgi:hypothetical protein
MKESENINEQIEKDIAQSVISYGDNIHSAYRLTCGISGWYKAYIGSEEFQKLSPEFKKESFEIYDKLTSMFDFLEYKVNEIEPSTEEYLKTV